jgi:hypothetical protein
MLLVNLLGAAIPLAPPSLRAKVIALDQGMSKENTRTGWVPYLFSNDSSLIAGAVSNLRVAGSRFFTDGFVLADHFTDQRFYGYVEQDPAVRGGSNDSDSSAGVDLRLVAL